MILVSEQKTSNPASLSAYAFALYAFAAAAYVALERSSGTTYRMYPIVYVVKLLILLYQFLEAAVLLSAAALALLLAALALLLAALASVLAAFALGLPAATQ